MFAFITFAIVGAFGYQIMNRAAYHFGFSDFAMDVLGGGLFAGGFIGAGIIMIRGVIG